MFQYFLKKIFRKKYKYFIVICTQYKLIFQKNFGFIKTTNKKLIARFSSLNQIIMDVIIFPKNKIHKHQTIYSYKLQW